MGVASEIMSLDELFAGCDSQPSTPSRPGKGNSRGEEGGGGKEVLVRLDTEGDCPVLYSLVQCKPQAFSILASDGHKAWTGVIAHKKLGEMANKVKMEVKELLAVTRKALTREDIGSVEFLYTTKLVQKGEEESLELVWKKHLVAGDIKVQLGSVLLEPHHSHVVLCRMLEQALSKMAEFQTAIQELESERARLVDERMSALQRLDKCVSMKEELEADLYGKFKMVLNEKKAKVRRLMESLSYLSSQQQQARAAKTSVLEEEGKGRDDFEADTDEEDGSGASPTPSPKPKQPSSPPRATSTTEGVSSLLRNDWQDENTSPPVKRRRREPRKPAVQPEIPRSSRSISSSSSTSERLQAASRESPEPDDLLHQL